MKNQIYRALAIQYIVGCLFLIGLSIWNLDTVFSGFVGCLAALLPATYISSRMARKTNDYSAQQWLSYAYKTQLGKWFMTIMMFALILSAEYNWSFAVLFTGFCLVQITSCIVPLMIKGD
ncbi:MAG: F0F1-type ATP synthase assembly protein I [Gammaproteobacteria bacterium]|jgi:F0F1-type ATP synthase assembly protein I